MTGDKLYTSLSANTIMANYVQGTRLITSSTDKHYSLDSEDDFRSGYRNVSHQQQFFSELHSPGRSHYTNCHHFVGEWDLGRDAQRVSKQKGLRRVPWPGRNELRKANHEQCIITSNCQLYCQFSLVNLCGRESLCDIRLATNNVQ